MPLQQDVTSLDIPASQQKDLMDKGFNTVEDIRNDNEFVCSLDLEKLTKVPQTRTALQYLEEEESAEMIRSFLDNLDTVLNGLLKHGLITELVGLPGSGRTQLCLHLSVSAQIKEIMFVEKQYIFVQIWISQFLD
ncbi:hypothetical protein HHI36_015919 [Cryptolaemus montrouzieri]|uniref:DNA repair protein RAD51 homolog 3 n=1 Tax=Cryptolaemus montrouzieri TaxID=559131 RepID=A0ABD2N7I4_9CUCU